MSLAAATQTQDTLRYSTYSGAPSLHPSIAPTDTSRDKSTEMNVEMKEKVPVINIPRSPSQASTAVDDRSMEIKGWAAHIERLVDQRLEQQRFVPSEEKTDEISTNALGAKVEKALGRRMSAQDAEFTRRPSTADNEKPIEISAQ